MSGIDEGMLPEHVQPGQQDDQHDAHTKPAASVEDAERDDDGEPSTQDGPNRATEPKPIDTDQSSG